jgi:DNA-binding PadR family transcriptional regulator
MPIQHAVLAMLARAPSHSYELKTRFEAEIGPQWGQWNIGHIYQIVDRLVRDGLIKGRRIEQDDRPDKVRYALTAAGRAELASWIETPWARQSGYRDELFLKLYAATLVGEEALRTVIRDQRAVYLAELGSLGELRGAHRDDPLVSLLIDAATLHTQADLEIVERAEAALREVAEASPAVKLPAASRPSAGRGCASG